MFQILGMFDQSPEDFIMYHPWLPCHVQRKKKTWQDQWCGTYFAWGRRLERCWTVQSIMRLWCTMFVSMYHDASWCFLFRWRSKFTQELWINPFPLLPASPVKDVTVFLPLLHALVRGVAERICTTWSRRLCQSASTWTRTARLLIPTIYHQLPFTQPSHINFPPC